ncbi:protein YeaG [Yersinia pseudotuberculosis]|nr:PrkA family serine protein kinase [Yersinia pseudotuberculosis]SUP85988.1 protein YeaG [Yersinia pseudotuberculosis]
MAIGEPVMVDTALESRMSRLFSNRVILRLKSSMAWRKP